ncbi:hypothetical protein J5N97_001162 [Dioscorea zingiberensis]|uniref:Uncharacterized protein n=1 Tax=Dioscorea zingiberensis TaxID=325984 RepID=A0A9D5BUT1_9LILI|nr:hypothetical protein J5N97_001162 [Dioscorea zingiberensis]
MGSLSIYLLFTLIVVSTPQQSTEACFTSIFSFGDSNTDCGNLLFILNNLHRISRLPYGETFFHRPTGRFSDGRLVVDFLAEAFELPLLLPNLPYLDDDRRFENGANFAVGGATALDELFFNEKGIPVFLENISLDAQLKWFKQLLSSQCSSGIECENNLSSSLFIMGLIGGNDYNHPLFYGRNFEEVRTFVPSVINAISSAITALIGLGARTLLVPGNFPIGCNSAHLSIFHVPYAEDYDEKIGCIKWLNEFAEYHNHLLITELDHLRKMHPHATIIYADYYQALMTIYQSPEKYGFQSSPLGACCGSGALYNYNSSCLCGESGSTVCMEPSRYVSWDGMHLTEAANSFIVTGLLQGKFTNPPFTQTCFLGKVETIGRNLELPHNGYNNFVNTACSSFPGCSNDDIS